MLIEEVNGFQSPTPTVHSVILSADRISSSCRSWFSDGDDLFSGHVVYYGGSHVDPVFSLQLLFFCVAMDNV